MRKVNVDNYLSQTASIMHQLVSVDVVTPKKCVMEVNVDRNLGMAVPMLKNTVSVGVERLVIVLKVNVETCQGLIVRIMRLLVSVDVAILKNHVAIGSVDRNLLVIVPTLGRTADVVVD